MCLYIGLFFEKKGNERKESISTKSAWKYMGVEGGGTFISTPPPKKYMGVGFTEELIAHNSVSLAKD